MRNLALKLTKIVLKLFGFKIEYHSQVSQLPQQFILVANHVSLLDGIILLLYFPDVYILGDIEHKDIPILGRILTNWRYIGIDRKSQTSKIFSLDRIINYLIAGKSILIFPQGSTSRTIESFNIGAFVASKKTMVPIVPVFFAFQSLDDFCFSPPWNVFKSIKTILQSNNKEIKLYILPQIDPQTFTTSRELCEHVLSVYKNWYNIYQITPLLMQQTIQYWKKADYDL